jgi:hypothetical protein
VGLQTSFPSSTRQWVSEGALADVLSQSQFTYQLRQTCLSQLTPHPVVDGDLSIITIRGDLDSDFRFRFGVSECHHSREIYYPTRKKG